MNPRRAVSATVKYAEFFHFPLSPQEVRFWLITNKPISFSLVKPFLTKPMSQREKKIRTQASLFSKQKTTHARRLINILRYIPGLKLVALTGSVAAGNSHSNDDIDLFFVTYPHTLWLVRPLVLLLITIFFRRRYPGEDHSKAANAFCPNLWLDSLSLSVPVEKRNLYTAHEVLQIVPLLDRGDTYKRFLYQNRWVKKYLANAYQALTAKNSPSSATPVIASPDRSGRGSLIPEGVNLTPALFFLLAPLNYLFYLIQLLYMFPKKTSETVHLHSAFLHTTDYSSRISSYLKIKTIHHPRESGPMVPVGGDPSGI